MDLISKKDLINRLIPKYRDGVPDEYDRGANDMLEEVIEAIEEFPAQNKWIPVKYRELTEEEKQDYPNETYIYDCELPEDAQDVIITTKYRQVVITTFYRDAEDGCWFDSYEDWEIKNIYFGLFEVIQDIETRK